MVFNNGKLESILKDCECIKYYFEFKLRKY